MMKFTRICVIVLDSVGIGELPDANQFGDQGAHTLGHIAQQVPGIQLPHMQRLGLGNIDAIPAIPSVDNPTAYYGKMAETSVGKDTMTGHWELMGLNVPIPFEVYPDGFPEPLIRELEERTGRKVIGNKPSSGTDILDEFGEEQMQSGAWIVYTSADSVLQIAAHEDVIPLEELYQACEIAREMTRTAPYAVGRVIARPYVGKAGDFVRTSNRHDYALKPFAPTVLNALQDGGYDVIAVGKINDIFSGEGITQSVSTVSNVDGIIKTVGLLTTDFNGLLFTNLVDFDSLYGHRRDPEGYAACLVQFDTYVPSLLEAIGEEGLLIITADHGNDPVHPGTDHTREYVPLLAYSPQLRRQASSIGVLDTFADLAATIADNFGVVNTGEGTSFLSRFNGESK